MTKRVWPEADPPSSNDWGNSVNMNGTNYKRTEVQPGKWEWRIDEDAEAYARKRRQEQSDLAWAFRTRPLTDEEMAQVRALDYHLFVQENTPFYAEEKRREFNDALLRQYQMREMAQAKSA